MSLTVGYVVFGDGEAKGYCGGSQVKYRDDAVGILRRPGCTIGEGDLCVETFATRLVLSTCRFFLRTLPLRPCANFHTKHAIQRISVKLNCTEDITALVEATLAVSSCENAKSWYRTQCRLLRSSIKH